MCVTDNLPGFGSSTIVTIGRVYVVEDLYVGSGGKYEGVLALVLKGIRGRQNPGLHHGLFQKLDDHTPDEFDREVIEQMNGAPVAELV